MQSYKFDDIIERACEKKQLDREMMKSISDFVFSETKKEMGRFTNLRIYLEGLVAFFYGKVRLIDFKDKLENQHKFKYKISFLAKKSEKEVEEVKEKVDNLLNVYEEFIKEKKETKKAYRERKNGTNTEV